jgi:hypothetical protein
LMIVITLNGTFLCYFVRGDRSKVASLEVVGCRWDTVVGRSWLRSEILRLSTFVLKSIIALIVRLR